MKIRLLGAHNLESCETRHTCFLIDGVLSIDAGSLVTSLCTSEQYDIREIVLTHRHLDHTRDIPALGLATWRHPEHIQVHSLHETLRAVHHHLLNDEMYPDLTQELSGRQPKYRFHAVKPEVTFHAGGYEVLPVAVPHTAPAVGYVVRSGSGACAAFTGDMGGGLLPFFQNGATPSVVFVETTFPDRLMDLARVTGHLTPSLLRRELEAVIRARAKPPRVVVVHMSVGDQEELNKELYALRNEMEIDLELGYQDMMVVI